MVKDKQIRARVDQKLYERITHKTTKQSDFVRDAVIEKLEREEYGEDSTVLLAKKELELIIESKQNIIKQYHSLIELEQRDIEYLKAKIDEKDRILNKLQQEENSDL